MTGDTLRQARENQGLSIQDIEKGTSIRGLYIECIEKGEFDKLPGEAYTKGFIRNYANFLKLDADALVKEYMEENHPEKLAAQQAAEAAAMQQPSHRPAPQPRRTVESEPSYHHEDSFSTGKDFHQRVEDSHRRQNLLVVLLVVIIVGAGAFFLLSSDDSTAEKTQPVKQTQQTQKPAQQPAQQAAAAPAKEEKKYEDVEVSAKLTDACWVSVKADGKTIFEGTLKKGEDKAWKAKDKVVITAGNAGAISFTVNGKDLGKVGDIGQVAEKTFTKDHIE